MLKRKPDIRPNRWPEEAKVPADSSTMLGADRAARMVTYRFRDVSTIMDHLHQLLDFEPVREKFVPPLREDDYLRLKLTLHEWLANLVQHADFAQHMPEITLVLRREGRRVACQVDDNTLGFDLENQLAQLHDAAPERERGRGLLIMRACTQDLSYRPLSPNKHRLAFYVSAEQDPCTIDIPC